jgi:hypothetical protein
MLDLLNGPLAPLVERALDKEVIRGAGLSLEAVNSVVRSVRSRDPGTAEATLHAVLVYLSWWKRHGQH